MSQYPYQPPQPAPYGYGYYPQDPLGALLAPAKRASIIMFILGGLMLPCGAIFGAVGGMADFSQLPPQQAARIQEVEQQLSSMGWTMKQFFGVMGATLAIPGLILLILGALVRRGGMVSVVGSIVVCGLLGLVAALMTVSAAVQMNGCGAVLFLLVLVALIAAEVFLFQAAGRAGQLAAYRGGMMGAYPQPYAQGYPQQPQYPSQQPQVWQQPGAGQWGQQPGWGQQAPPPPPPPPPPSDREG